MHRYPTPKDYGEKLIGRKIRFVPPTPHGDHEQLELQITDYISEAGHAGDNQVTLIGNALNSPSNQMRVGVPGDIAIEFIDDVEELPAP